MRFILLLALVLTFSVEASYRVHQLKLTYYDNQGTVVKEETVLSTLDHLQYEHYHGGFRTVRAQLEDTWYCAGDTSRKALCPRPAEGPVRGPASSEPKRNALPIGRQPVIP
jgi:hypothetical protein